MTYLKKPRWIDKEDEDRPFPVVLRPTREEMEVAEPVQFYGEDEYAEHAADLHHLADDFDTTEDRVLVAEPDPLLDEPEWGGRKNQPEIKTRKSSLQLVLELDEENDGTGND
jgi:hypothetical protein